MSKHKNYLPEFEPPKKKLITEYDQHVKTLFKAQGEISSSLQLELQKSKQFEKRIECFPLNISAGTSSLKQLKADEEKHKEVVKLLSYGLSQNDVKLYQEFRHGGLEQVKKKHPNHEPGLLKEKVDVILNIIIQKQQEIREIATPTSDLILHPMHDIKSIESHLFASLNDSIIPEHSDQDMNKMRRKTIKSATRLRNPQVQECFNNVASTSSQQKDNSLWDKIECPKEIKLPILTQKSKTYTCKKQTFYTIKDGVIEEIKEDEESVLVTGQLTLQEIRKLPPFASYSEGTPTNVIYVKNLPRKTTVDDLKRYYGRFIANEYKIMNGKMRGQAFMTFDSVETATQVLTTLNGLVVNEKPVILQFARGCKQPAP